MTPFLPTLIRCATAAFCVVALTIGGCHAYSNKLFAENGYVSAARFQENAWIKPQPR